MDFDPTKPCEPVGWPEDWLAFNTEGPVVVRDFVLQWSIRAGSSPLNQPVSCGPNRSMALAAIARSAPPPSPAPDLGAQT